MKKLLLATTALLIHIVPIQAAMLISDSFPTNGNLVGTTPLVGGVWTTISGAASPLQVSGGSLLIPNSNAEDAASQFASAQAGSMFAGFDFTVTTLPSLTPGGSYMAAFRDGTPSSGTFVGRLMVRRITGTPANEFQIGVANAVADLNTAGSVLWGNNLTANTMYRIVLRYDTTTDQTTLWVNPVTIASTSVTATDVVDVINMDGFGFRSSSPSSGGESIDNLKVATTFAEVIPEPSTYVLMGLGFGVVLWRIRRRHSCP